MKELTTEQIYEENRWIPERNGEIYCSPACGRGCTFQEYELAMYNAGALCKLMGAGWSPRVWENLGWHYTAKIESENAECEIYTHGINIYWIDLQIAGIGQITLDTDNPVSGYKDILYIARDQIASALSGLNELDAISNGKGKSSSLISCDK